MTTKLPKDWEEIPGPSFFAEYLAAIAGGDDMVKGLKLRFYCAVTKVSLAQTRYYSYWAWKFMGRHLKLKKELSEKLNKVPIKECERLLDKAEWALDESNELLAKSKRWCKRAATYTEKMEALVGPQS